MERVFNQLMAKELERVEKTGQSLDRDAYADLQLAITAIDAVIALQKNIPLAIHLFKILYSEDATVEGVTKIGDHISNGCKNPPIDCIENKYGYSLFQYCEMIGRTKKSYDDLRELVHELISIELGGKYKFFGGDMYATAMEDAVFSYNTKIRTRPTNHKCIDRCISNTPDDIMKHTKDVLYNDWLSNRGKALSEILNLVIYRYNGSVNPTTYDKFYQFLHGQYIGVYDKSHMSELTESVFNFIGHTSLLREIIDFREGDYHKELSLTYTQFICDFAQLIRYMELEELKYLSVKKSVMKNDFNVWFFSVIEVISMHADLPWWKSLIDSFGCCYNYEELEFFMKFIWYCSEYSNMTKEQFDEQTKEAIYKFTDYPISTHTEYDNISDEIRILAISYMKLTKFNESENLADIDQLINHTYEEKMRRLKNLNFHSL